MHNYGIGGNYDIHCYKHDSTIYKYWDEAIFLEENDDYVVFANRNTKVIESDGKSWRTKEPAIMFFYKKHWFNIICQLKENGKYFYCNMASPYIIDGTTLKYIDYDLDLRVFPNGAFKVLDRGEYNYHKKLMGYSEDIDKIIKSELTYLINMAKEKKEPFNGLKIDYYYNLYLMYKKKQK